jgi:hypothetical protein
MLPVLTTLLLGCAKTPGTVDAFSAGIASTPSPHAELCRDSTMDDQSFCMPSHLETWLREGDLRFLEGEPVGQGASGVMRMDAEIRHADLSRPLIVDVKWKPAPRSFDGLNNSPRKEVAAYQVQKLFLPEDLRVVPPTVVRCVPTRPGHEVADRAGGPALPCVWGVVSQWVHNIEPPGAVDHPRFLVDPDYREQIANLNVFMYVIGHRDTHSENWFLSTDPQRLRAVSIDNGVAFSGLKNILHPVDWSQIHVPAVSRDTIERLRGISPADVDALRNLGAWRVTSDGVDRIDADEAVDEGITFEDGVLAHGLTAQETLQVLARIRDLVERVDRGELATFP